jgi:hypothetical protein
MSNRFDPHTESTCRLCRQSHARVRFTDDQNVIDVECPTCGQFRIEIPGYHIDMNSLSDPQRDKLIAFVNHERTTGDVSPLITRERLQDIIGTVGR